jgi:hypothetical protein
VIGYLMCLCCLPAGLAAAFGKAAKRVLLAVEQDNFAEISASLVR